MKERKSMRGVTVDLGKLMTQQEKNIAVGNTKSNARGDQLGRAGRVIKSADELAREHYNRNNPNAVKKTSLKIDVGQEEFLTSDTKKPVKDDWEETVDPINDVVEDVTEDDLDPSSDYPKTRKNQKK